MYLGAIACLGCFVGVEDVELDVWEAFVCLVEAEFDRFKESAWPCRDGLVFFSA